MAGFARAAGRGSGIIGPNAASAGESEETESKDDEGVFIRKCSKMEELMRYWHCWEKIIQYWEFGNTSF